MNSAALALEVVLCLSAAAPAALVAQEQPDELRVRRARPQESRVVADLRQSVEELASSARGVEWVAYTVPLLPGNHRLCCGAWDRPGSVCGLDAKTWSTSTNGEALAAEAPRRELAVILRLAAGEATEVRVLTTDCELDAGDRPLHRLEGASGEASVALLSSWIDSAPKRRADEALTAIAFHDGEAAWLALERSTEGAAPVALREQAAFWIGVTRGERGLKRLERLLHGDPSGRVREQVVFAISQNGSPRALEVLIATARRDPDAGLRSRALFWLAQKAGDRAAAVLGEAIAEDPELEVKLEAVFALSQLPREEGVPHLLRLARSSRQPEVRRRALFWLGQSGDPRALELIEELLER